MGDLSTLIQSWRITLRARARADDLAAQLAARMDRAGPRAAAPRFGAGGRGRGPDPGDLVVALRGWSREFAASMRGDTAEGRALEALEEIRITASPSWADQPIDVFITFSPPTRVEADQVMAEDQWDELVDSWLRRAEPFGAVGSIDGAMIPLDEFTGREYVDSDPLDLDYLSWAEAAS